MEEDTQGTEKQTLGYDLLIEKIEKLEKRIDEQNKTIADVTNMNRALLSGTEKPSQTIDKIARHKELEAKLQKGIK